MTKKEETILKNNYYKAGNYWKGILAIKKLSSVTGINEEKTKFWLEKQALWQIYLRPPKYIPRPHWELKKINEIHQADLLFLPHDKVGKNLYKYVLDIVIDIASRYKDAQELTSKNSEEVSSAFKTIYSRKLNWPKTLIVDPGTEFKGNVTILMEKT